jgi:hypothetical protein
MAGEGRRMFGDTVPSELPDKWAMSIRQPIGVAGIITPWNFPIAIPCWKMTAALISGNTVVLKPASDTPHCAALLVEIMDQAGKLLSAVDDLDTAARIETRRVSFDEAPIDAVALLCRLHDAYERVARQRGSRIAIEIEQNLPAARVELAAAERMFARMLAATIGLAREGEVIGATMGMGVMAAAQRRARSADDGPWRPRCAPPSGGRLLKVAGPR